MSWSLLAAPLLGLALAPLLERLIRWLPGTVIPAAGELVEEEEDDPVPYTAAGMERRRVVLLVVVPALFLLVAWRFGETIRTPVALLYMAWFVVIAAVDLEHRLIPNLSVLPAIPIAGLTAYAWDISLVGMALGAATEFSLFLVSYVLSPRLLGKQAVAEGDLKLAIPLGMIQGFPRVFAGLFAMSLLSALASVVLLASRRRGMRDYIPFAPFMVGGAAVALFLSS